MLRFQKPKTHKWRLWLRNYWQWDNSIVFKCSEHYQPFLELLQMVTMETIGILDSLSNNIPVPFRGDQKHCKLLHQSSPILRDCEVVAHHKRLDVSTPAPKSNFFAIMSAAIYSIGSIIAQQKPNRLLPTNKLPGADHRGKMMVVPVPQVDCTLQCVHSQTLYNARTI